MSQWTKVFETSQPIQAELMAQMLRAAGIEAVILNKRDQNYHYGTVHVLVSPDNALAAWHLIQNQSTIAEDR